MNNIQNGKILKCENDKRVQSALIILGEDGHIYVLTATPNGDFLISDEGIFDERNDLNEFLCDS